MQVKKNPLLLLWWTNGLFDNACVHLLQTLDVSSYMDVIWVEVCIKNILFSITYESLEL